MSIRSTVLQVCAAGGVAACGGLVIAAGPQDESRSETPALADAFYQDEQTPGRIADAFYQQESVPILSDVPLLGHLFQEQVGPGRYRGVAYDAWAQPLALTRPQIDEAAVAVLGVALDENSQPLQVWLNNVQLGDEYLTLTAHGNVLIRTAEGDEACTIQADAIRLLTVLEHGDETAKRGRIGITMEDVPEALASQLRVDPAEAVMVLDVLEEGPARRAGLIKYDVITRVEGEDGVTQDTLRDVVAKRVPGETITLHLIREGRLCEVEVEVEPAPEPDELTVDTAADGSTYWHAVQNMQTDGSLNVALEAATQYLVADENQLIAPTVTYQPQIRQWVAQEDGDGLISVVAQPQWRTARLSRQQVDLTDIQQNGLTLQLRPRVLDGQVVIDSWMVNPSRVVDLTVNLEAADDCPIARLRTQLGALKDQVAALESTIAELESEAGGDD